MAECVPNRKLIAELMEKEEKRLENETPKSYELYKRAIKHMPKGVSSTYQARDPYPVYFTHGKGSKIWSVDGQEISDFHNGFGCMVQGHAHPAIVEAIKKRASWAPSSPCRPRTPSSWPSTWPATSGCPSGAS